MRTLLCIFAVSVSNCASAQDLPTPKPGKAHEVLARDVGTWVDNFSTIPMQLKGEYDEKSKTYTVHSTVVDETGHELKQKKVTTWIDEPNKKVEIFWVVEEGGENLDIKIMEMTAKRRN